MEWHEQLVAGAAVARRAFQLSQAHPVFSHKARHLPIFGGKVGPVKARHPARVCALTSAVSHRWSRRPSPSQGRWRNDICSSQVLQSTRGVQVDTDTVGCGASCRCPFHRVAIVAEDCEDDPKCCFFHPRPHHTNSLFIPSMSSLLLTCFDLPSLSPSNGLACLMWSPPMDGLWMGERRDKDGHLRWLFVNGCSCLQVSPKSS